METDLSIRLHLYATAAERLARGDTAGCADAISCWRSATASHSAAIICSHTRVLRGEGEDVLEKLLADKHGKTAEAGTGQADPETEKPRNYIPLHPGDNSAALLTQGAEGVRILKGRND